MYLLLTASHLSSVVEHCISFGYSDGAYIYTRMLARLFLDVGDTGWDRPLRLARA